MIRKTPLYFSDYLSKFYKANIILKREDLQVVRSFKIRGAYNKIKNSKFKNDIVTASAGNHAQGVAYVCNQKKINHHIFIPQCTPKQKIDRIKYFGGEHLNIYVIDSTLNEVLSISNEFAKNNNFNYVHPFNDLDVINGQGEIAEEIYSEMTPDIIIAPVGGGGLISGIIQKTRDLSARTEIIGVEPLGSCSLYESLKNDRITTIENNDDFVDGASVKTMGDITFNICRNNIDNVQLIDNNHLCNTIVNLYQNDGIISEPAGALAISALDNLCKEYIKNKNIVCILSGGNNDIMRYSTFIEKSLIYRDLKHYFIVKFNQIPGELRAFVNNIVPVNVDITRFEYLKKNNIKTGSVLIGMELENKSDLEVILEMFSKNQINYTKLDPEDSLFDLLI